MAGHMAPSRTSSDGGTRGIRRAGDEAFQLTVDYLKQEALEPLKGLGRFLAWGVAGSFAIAIGILLLLVGVLRLLQAETGTALTGDWSWVPYFAVSLLGAAVAGVAGWRITAGPAKPKRPPTNTAAGEIQAVTTQSSGTTEGSS
jgi:predicted cobalt transporter CbtA